MFAMFVLKLMHRQLMVVNLYSSFLGSIGSILHYNIYLYIHITPLLLYTCIMYRKSQETNNNIDPKESVNSDGQQFHQYQQSQTH
jgi:hypothetical protein